MMRAAKAIDKMRGKKVTASTSSTARYCGRPDNEDDDDDDEETTMMRMMIVGIAVVESTYPMIVNIICKNGINERDHSVTALICVFNLCLQTIINFNDIPIQSISSNNN